MGVKVTANSKQKLKLLYLQKMLDEETDGEHGLSMTEILERLAAEGISAERKSIYRDLDVLRGFGLSIGTIRRMPVEYTLENRNLDLAEIMLLVDAVQSSKFLTKRTSKRLVDKISTLACVHDRDKLDKLVHVDGRIKSQNDSVFYNVDTIHEALARKRKVRFSYYKYGTDLERKIQHEGKPYVLTPVKIVFSDGFYYLVTWSDKHEDFVRFRVDRMRFVQVSEERATSNERIANYAFEDFEHKSFGMFDGEEVTAHLLVQPDAMDIIVDRFGLDITSHGVDDGCAEVLVPVRKSAQFFGWVAGMDGSVTISGPESLRGEYLAWLKDLADRS